MTIAMIRLFSMLCLSLLMTASAGAQALAPDALIKSISDDVIGIIKQDKDIKAGDRKKINELVDAKVLPHFNFERMTRLAVGKSWRTATPEQKQALVAEFRTLLVRTYTKAFTSYRDQTVEVKPVKLAADATEVTIKTAIIKPGAQQPILVDYDMEKKPDGWKVYDLTVEGVSLVTSYRGTFADQVQQTGIDGLIKTLVEKNQAAANAAATQKAESK